MSLFMKIISAFSTVKKGDFCLCQHQQVTFKTF